MLAHPVAIAGIALYSGVSWTQILILGEPLLLATLAAWDLRNRRDSSRRFGLAIGILNALFGIGYGAALQNSLVAFASALSGIAFAVLLAGRIGDRRSGLVATSILLLGNLLMFVVLMFGKTWVYNAAELARSGQYPEASILMDRVAPILTLRGGSNAERALILTRRVEFHLRAGNPQRAFELAPTLRQQVSRVGLAFAGERGHSDQQSLPFALRWRAMPILEALAYTGTAFREPLPDGLLDPLHGALSHPADRLSWSRTLLPAGAPLGTQE